MAGAKPRLQERRQQRAAESPDGPLQNLTTLAPYGQAAAAAGRRGPVAGVGHSATSSTIRSRPRHIGLTSRPPRRLPVSAVKSMPPSAPLCAPPPAHMAAIHRRAASTTILRESHRDSASKKCVDRGSITARRLALDGHRRSRDAPANGCRAAIMAFRCEPSEPAAKGSRGRRHGTPIDTDQRSEGP